MTSQSTEEWLAEKMRELEAKKHCRCEGSPPHGHCLSCHAHVAEGESKCSRCEDLEKRRRYCLQCSNNFYLEVVEGSTSVPHQFGFCGEECYKVHLAGVLKSNGIPPKFMSCTLEGFNGYTKGLAEKLQRIRHWIAGDLSTGLYLFGGVGTGKTHLAVGLMRALRERGLRGKFMVARSFIMRCQTAFRVRESADDIVDEILGGADFLILDDVGSEKGTDYTRQALLHLVDECYTREVALIITSNVDLRALNQIDQRIASRIVEMCNPLRFEEPDYRVAIAKNRAKNASRGTQDGIQPMLE